jgi:hypothetical protein
MMNERIQALLSQCTQESIDGPFATPYVDQVKFTKLLVKECTRIIASQALESQTAGANSDWTEFNALSRVAGQIKKHFGVE